MKSVVIISVVFTITLSNCAPSGSKLEFLGEQGYEVISGAEEFITALDSDGSRKHTGIDSLKGITSNGDSNPDIILYGKFYVLQKRDTEKGFQDRISNIVRNTGFKSSFPARNSPSIMDAFLPRLTRILQKQNTYQNANHNIPVDAVKPQVQDFIVFPSEEPIQKKKYIRSRKEPEQGLPTSSRRTQTSRASHPLSHAFSPSESRNVRNKALPSRSTSTTPTTTTPLPSTSTTTPSTPMKEDLDFEAMSSAELFEWTKNNLNMQGISKLVKGEDLEGAGDGSEESTTDFPGIGYNSFIQVPEYNECPEGQKKDQNGNCQQLYIHRVTTPRGLSQRLDRGSVKAKLAALLEVLKAIKKETIEGIKKSEKELLEEAQNILKFTTSPNIKIST